MNPLHVIVLFIVAVQAMAFAGPKATDFAAATLHAHSSAPTEAAHIHDLLRRQDVDSAVTAYFAKDNTCGFVDGDSTKPYSCVSTDTCVVLTDTISSAVHGFVGCWNAALAPSGYYGFSPRCVNSVQYRDTSICDSECSTNNVTLKCTATSAPYCRTVSFYANIPIVDHVCVSTYETTTQAVFTTYYGESDGRQFSASVVAAPASFTAEGSTTSPTTPVSTTPVSTSPIPAPPTSTPATASNSTPVGPIVGGVVGGVAVLALIAAGIFLLLRRKKAPSTPAPQQAAYQSEGKTMLPMSSVSPSAYSAQQHYSYQSPPGSPPPNYPNHSAQNAFATQPQSYGAGAQAFHHQSPGSPVSATSPHRMSAVTSIGSPSGAYADLSTSPMAGHSVQEQPSTAPRPIMIHEISGHSLDAHDRNADHHGQMHELD